MPSIASVFVEVLPETSKIAAGIEEAFRRVDATAREAGRRWSREIQSGMGEVDVNLKADTAKAKEEIKRAAEDQKTTIEVGADTAKAKAEIDEAAHDRRTTIHVNTDRGIGGGGGFFGDLERDATRAIESAVPAMAQAAGQGGQLAGQAASEGFKDAMSGIPDEAKPLMMAGLASAIPELIGMVAQLSGAIALLPSVLAAAGAGFGVFKLGMDGITDAYTAVSGASKTAAADAQSHADKVTSASRAVSSASQSLASSVRSEAQAQKDVTQARKDAARELEDLTDKLRDSTLNEAQAKLDLQKAQEELATGTFATSTDYQQAQLNVLEAQQRLTEAQKSNSRTQQDANDTRAKGVEGNDKVVASEQRLADAQQATANAQAQLADAQTHLVETQNELSSSAQKAKDAMAGLSPNAQALVNTMVGLTPTLQAFKFAIQDAFTANLGPMLQNTVNTILPAIQPGLTRIAGAFNTVFQNVGSWLTDPKNVAMIQGMIDNIATAFQNLAPAVRPLMDALGTLTSVGASFLPGLASQLADAATRFGKFIQDAAASGSLQKFIQGGIDAINTIAPLIPKLIGDFEKFAPIGEKTLPSVVDAIGKIADGITNIMTSGIGQFLALTLGPSFGTVEVATASLSGTINILSAAFGWLRDVGRDLHGWFDRLKSIIPEMANLVTSVLLPVFQPVLDKIKELTGIDIKAGWHNAIESMKIDFDNLKNFVVQHADVIKTAILTMFGIPPWLQELIKKFSTNTTSGQPVPEPPPGGPAPAAPPGTPPPGGPAPQPGTPEWDKAPKYPGAPMDNRNMIVGTNIPYVAPPGFIEPGAPGPQPSSSGPSLPRDRAGNPIQPAPPAGPAPAAPPGTPPEGVPPPLTPPGAPAPASSTGTPVFVTNWPAGGYGGGGGGGGGAAAPVAPAAGDTPLVAALKTAGFTPEQIRLIQGFAQVEGPNPSGVPTLGFPDNEIGGSDLQTHVNALKRQFADRASVAGPFPTGGTDLAQAQWMAKLVGQGGIVDYHGDQQPADYVQRVVAAMQGFPAAGAPTPATPGAPTPTGAYPGDTALLAHVPSGQYLQTQAADLTQGIGDCSSAVEDLINLMNGVTTAGRNMSTGNAAQWLTAHGFVATNQPMPGTFQVGFNPEHMQATLPGGTNFNWGSSASAAAGGVGGTGAWDPAFTSHYYLPGSSTTTAGGAGPVVLNPNIPPGQQKTDKEAASGKGEELGKDFIAGLFEAFGFDGSVFKDPSTFGIVKLGSALFNYFGKIGKAIANPQGQGGDNTNGQGGGGNAAGDLFGGGGGGGPGDLVNSLISLVPQPFGQPQSADNNNGNGNGVNVTNDHSIHMHDNNFRDTQDVLDQVRGTQMPEIRVAAQHTLPGQPSG